MNATPTPNAEPTTAAPPRWSRPVRGRWIGLQDKLLVSNMLLIVTTLLFCGASFTWHSGEQLRRSREQEIIHVSSVAAITASEKVAAGDTTALSHVAGRVLGIPGVRRVSFYDPSGRALAGWSRAPSGQLSPIEQEAMPVAPEDVRALHVRAGDEQSTFTVPLRDASGNGPDLGYLAVTTVHDPALAEAQEPIRMVVGGGLAILAVVLPLIFLLVQRAFAPIRRLAVAARNVAGGRFETVDIKRGDALGVLADAFNHMVTRLGEQKRRADEAHARLLEANLHLEHKIAERTSAIEAASQRLENEIAEKEDFLRAVSHDLNAPLRNIDGMVSMLLRKHSEDVPAEVVNRLERIKKNVEHETSLISDLLELSRIKTRREQPEPVNLEEMMWELRGLFENDLREREIDLVIETRLPTVYAERARIRQVFQNLVDNAIKYMGDGPERRICVGARVELSETEFWVRDTGEGIAREDHGKIFYVFRRGHSQQPVAGKGVGLASVKSILENYNGRIWVESEPGQGSTFRFTFNGRFVPGDPAAPEASRGGAAAKERGAGGATKAA